MQRSFCHTITVAVLGVGLMLFACQANEALATESTEAKPQLFAVEIKTGPSWDASKAAHEQANFKEHSENLQRLRGEGKIVMGARYSDIGLIIISALTADEVVAMMEQDASMQSGTFVFAVHAFNMFYPFLNDN